MLTTTPKTALLEALYDDAGQRRTHSDTLAYVLARARKIGGPAAAAAEAGRAAPDNALCGAVRPVAPAGAAPEPWRPLIWLRPDQSWAAAYALERGCAVLVAGTAVPDGWEAR